MGDTYKIQLLILYLFQQHIFLLILSNKAITEIEKFFDWIVTLRVETEVRAKKKVTSLPGIIASLKMDILTPNKV